MNWWILTLIVSSELSLSVIFGLFQSSLSEGNEQLFSVDFRSTYCADLTYKGWILCRFIGDDSSFQFWYGYLSEDLR